MAYASEVAETRTLKRPVAGDSEYLSECGAEIYNLCCMRSVPGDRGDDDAYRLSEIQTYYPRPY